MKKRNIILIIVCILVSALFLSSCERKKEDKEESETNTLVKTIELEGKQLDYFRFGNEEGDKIIILPGLSLKSVMGSAEAVVGAYGILSEGYDIYLFDHIKEEPEVYSIEEMAQDTVGAMDKLGLDHVNIMGVSLGGMIGQVISIKYPERVESLILCSSTSKVSENTQDLFKNWRKLAEERNIDELMMSFGENVYSRDFYKQYKDIIIASGQGATELDYSNFIVSIDAMMDFDVYDELDGIECPLFILGAGSDMVLGRQASLDIAEKLGCKYYIYENYGHGVYDEAPDYLSRIKEFLDGN